MLSPHKTPCNIALAFFGLGGIGASIYLIVIKQTIIDRCKDFVTFDRHHCLNQHNTDVCLYALGFCTMFFSAFLLVCTILPCGTSGTNMKYACLYFTIMLGFVFIIIYCDAFYERCASWDKECCVYRDDHLRGYMTGAIGSIFPLVLMTVIGIRIGC